MHYCDEGLGFMHKGKLSKDDHRINIASTSGAVDHHGHHNIVTFQTTPCQRACSVIVVDGN
jgi:hypothetical protein